MTEKDLLCENQELKKTIGGLKRRIAILERMVAIFENHSKTGQGVRGESIVANLLNGAMTAYNAPYDVRVEQSGLLLEVKFSGLNRAVRSDTTMRWAWSKPFGESGGKKYDRLILIGVKDPRHNSKYKDTDCPYIFFDVPFKEIMPLTIRTNAGKYRSIQLTTDPRRTHSSGSPLFSKYQVTLADLEQRYGI